MAAVAQFTWMRLLTRFIFALALVFLTYNPYSNVSLWGWVYTDFQAYFYGSEPGDEAPQADQGQPADTEAQTADGTDQADQKKSNLPLQVLFAIVLFIGWSIYLRATWRSLGAVGIIMAGAFFAALLWVLVSNDLIDLKADNKFTTALFLVIASAILALGMTWSMIRRRLSGQVDVTEEDSGDS